MELAALAFTPPLQECKPNKKNTGRVTGIQSTHEFMKVNGNCKWELKIIMIVRIVFIIIKVKVKRFHM